MKLEPILFEGHCYVLLQGNWVHPIVFHRHDLVWYPERAMTLYEQHKYRPYVKSVVTENAWVIGLYPREKVRIVEEDGRWYYPQCQTYAASFNNITHTILGISSTIPAITSDGGETIDKKIAEYAERIKKAAELYK